MRLFIAALVLGLGTSVVHAQKTPPWYSLFKDSTRKPSAAKPTALIGQKYNFSTATTQPLPEEGKDFVFSIDRSSGKQTQSVVMKWIPKGTFQMGSTSQTDPDRFPDETPHSVTFTRGFWMMKTEVTQEIYQAVTGTNPSQFQDPNNPVEKVSWNDANDFCKSLRNQLVLKQSQNLTGFEFRLPTEAEWEYACRAASGTAVYVFLNNRQSELDRIAWWHEIAQGTTHLVGQRQPNSWGLYDMIGNVWEWCSDWYGDYPTGSVTNPKGPVSGTERVFRGGGWKYIHSQYALRSAIRDKYAPEGKFSDIGFRVVLSPVR
jgi:formylglycine-generating enzyme required for sulfatase activity